ncbi:TIGR03086 family metal-binding protein [Sphaerisporangium rhizosphaerae]|uniref:TIGR03086 family metal-binding protein n=1 Tax=Sphaerisporangium rhizosphaerae TaxID=2269375 RepID=A0ABW2NYZ3_9ACTN
MDIRELDRRAVRASVDVVAAVTPADLRRPTPCAGWALSDLLAHMTAQHHGFAAAAEGNGDDLTAWKVHPAGEDAVPRYAEAAERVIAAFAGEDVPGRTFSLPEFGPDARFPAAMAMSFHFIDYVVHAWDVARTLGRPFTPEPDLVEAAWPIALAVPNGKERLAPGAAFTPALPAPADASRFHQILALLGRTPS